MITQYSGSNVSALDSGPISGRQHTGHWRPILTLLVLSPAIGELLSGSSPPLQFFNPLFFLLLVGLYGCGALLVRETAVSYGLHAGGIFLLGAAYGIIEEGLTCKSFFNPYWTDTGFLSVYGRAAGVNWVWAFGLTAYHAVVSITVPIFLTEALFPLRSKEPWLRRRGFAIAGSSLGLVVLLGFLGFDNHQFHLIEMKDPLALAKHLNAPSNPLSQFISLQLTHKDCDLVRKAVATQADSPDLRHALQDELNRLLPRADLYSPERFTGVPLPAYLKQQTLKPPHGDKLVVLNRSLLEHAFPDSLATRPNYPFRPGPWTTSICVLSILILILLALRQIRLPDPIVVPRRPWLKGIGFTIGYIVVGFILPSLAEHGAKIPALLVCGLWCAVAVLVVRFLRRIDPVTDRLWRRGLWALGVISPWVVFATLLGLVVRMIGAKSFSGMGFVALASAVAILILALKWKRRLAPDPRLASTEPFISPPAPV